MNGFDPPSCSVLSSRVLESFIVLFSVIGTAIAHQEIFCIYYMVSQLLTCNVNYDIQWGNIKVVWPGNLFTEQQY